MSPVSSLAWIWYGARGRFGGGGAMAIDRHRHGGDRVGHDVAQLGTRPAVDGAARQVEQQVDHPRLVATQKPREQLF